MEDGMFVDMFVLEKEAISLLIWELLFLTNMKITCYPGEEMVLQPRYEVLWVIRL